MAHPQPKVLSVLGLYLNELKTSTRAVFEPKHVAIIHDFIDNDSDFITFVQNNNGMVTPTRLRSFDVGTLAKALGCGGLKNRVTQQGLKVLPIVEDKIRSKLAKEWTKLNQASGSSSFNRGRSSSVATSQMHYEDEEEDEDTGAKVVLHQHFNTPVPATPSSSHRRSSSKAHSSKLSEPRYDDRTSRTPKPDDRAAEKLTKQLEQARLLRDIYVQEHQKLQLLVKKESESSEGEFESESEVESESESELESDTGEDEEDEDGGYFS